MFLEIDQGILCTVIPALACILLFKGFTSSSSQKTTSRSQSPTIPQEDPDNETKRLATQYRYRDKITFTFSIFNVGLTCFLLGHSPQHFYIWHTLKCVTFLPLRFLNFRKQLMHLFLMDLCYWANLYSLVYLFFGYSDAGMFQVLFMIANGPLAWSVPLFRNSLVLHSFPHMISLFIHFSPMALTYCLRWHSSPFTTQGDISPSMLDLVSLALRRFYIWWVVLYYFVVFVLLHNRTQRKGYITLFSWYTSRGTASRVLEGISGNHWVKKFVYILAHYTFGMLSMVWAAVLYRYQALHLVFMVGIALVATWNGAGFYFHVFSRRYEESLEKRVNAIAEVGEEKKKE